MKKSRLVIVDAMVIIDAHKHEFWSELLNKNEVCVTSTVLHNEATYFLDDSGISKIDLAADLKEGKITEISATVEQIQKVQSQFTDYFSDNVDPGELEAISFLKSDSSGDYKFCTADTAAIKALGALNLSSSGISLEEIIPTVESAYGLSGYGKAKFKKHLAEGFQQASLLVKKK